jgi:transposase InsO family protein
VVRKTCNYRPETNGKAERFIRTLLERWAYAYPYQQESERLAALPEALDFDNRFRPHRALGGLAPLQRCPTHGRQRPRFEPASPYEELGIA